MARLLLGLSRTIGGLLTLLCQLPEQPSAPQRLRIDAESGEPLACVTPTHSLRDDPLLDGDK